MSLQSHAKTLSGRARRVHTAVRGLGGLLDTWIVGGLSRPEPREVGGVLRGEFRIEQHLRSTDLKHDYLVSCVPGSAAADRCWECGHVERRLEQLYCTNCGMALTARTFLLSERWRTAPEPWIELLGRPPVHASLSRTYEVFEEDGRLCVLSDALDGNFLADLSSPLEADTLIHIGVALAEVLQFLEQEGVRLATLGKEHIALAMGGDVAIVDAELGALPEGRRAERYRGRLLEQLGRLLREFTPYDAPQLRHHLDELCQGRFERWEDVVERLSSVSDEAGRGERAADLSVAAMSDVGMARLLNEDIWGWERLTDEVSLFVVADGMGGHDNGEVASDLAVRTLLRGVRKRLESRGRLTDDLLESLLDAAGQEANNAVKAFADRRRTDMGTTLVCALVFRNRLAFVANVGDSRAYLLRGGQLKLISRDHSLVANLVAMGKITAEAARNHPHANILVRTVGKEWDVEVDVFRQELRSGDRLLLCSDGLWGEVEDRDIAAILVETADPRAACRELIRAANQRGGRDNITAILLNIP